MKALYPCAVKFLDTYFTMRWGGGGGALEGLILIVDLKQQPCEKQEQNSSIKLIPCLPVSSADNLSKQTVFDILMV